MKHFTITVLVFVIFLSCSSNKEQKPLKTKDDQTKSLLSKNSESSLKTLDEKNASLATTLKVNDNSQEKFDVQVFRISTDGKLVRGLLTVNGKELGNTFENDKLKIMPGTYPGFLRYISENGHVQGPDGYLGETGDFLLEIGNVTWSDGKKRSSLLFHGGNKPEQSQGCIMLGPVTRDAQGNRVLGPDHTLRKLRNDFYGTNDPISSPNKIISITIK